MENKFEESISRLEQIVQALENGDIDLDESLKLFEEGIKLTKSCQKMLDDAEKKVSVLMSDENGKIKKEEFNNEE
ncbi:MAG: exodeoxyribonuclease VII small subunit [Monoglobales bacterium]